MKRKISEIVSIQSGLFVRSGHKMEGDVVSLQAKHFDDFGGLRELPIKTVRIEDIDINYLLNEGDILFSAKGTRNFATVYKQEYGTCIASSTFFVLKIKKTDILPDYLAILLNELLKTSYFQSRLAGGTIQIIPKKVLGDCRIVVPDLSYQLKIIEAYTLYREQYKLYEDIKTYKVKLVHQIILDSQKELSHD